MVRITVTGPEKERVRLAKSIYELAASMGFAPVHYAVPNIKIEKINPDAHVAIFETTEQPNG
ncbi:MAG TPA: hypothetical protein VF787_03410 [Thermoanaerobaculia bacterium]